ncbi:MAG: glycoside hydrolase family 38 C-terminal domain-containing protein [Pseudomonadota bacterium]
MPLVVHMIGNAHLDPVWLWPWQEGLDEALATFRSAADRCDEYPEFIFTRGEAWQYEKLARYDPALFGRIAELVARGQWNVAGGQYIQPDLNAPTLESHRRQFRRGLAYFEKAFGVRPVSAFNVDSFGHPATFPDIVAPLGMIGYTIQRPKDFQMKLPQAFVWRGPAGHELITFRMSKPYTSMTIEELSGALEAAIEDCGEGLGHTMCFYGIGNHGGGPSKAQIEWILKNRTTLDGVELRFSTPDAYYRAIAPKKHRLPVIEGDLQHCFPGCYSVMHDIRQAQRHGELKLEQAQALIEVFAGEDDLADLYHQRLETGWDDLLFTAFHDILAGTSVKRSWPSVRAMQGRALIETEEVVSEATRRWVRRRLGPENAHRHVIINAEAHAWTGFLEIEPWLEDYANWDDRWLSRTNGQPVDFQLVQAEANIRSRVLVPIDVPAEGHEVLVIQPTPSPARSKLTDLRATGSSLSNGHVDIALGAGGLDQIKFHDKDTLGAGGLRLQLRDDPTDCWGMFNDSHEGEILSVWDTGGWVIEETGPLRARARLEGRLGTSRLLFLVSLYRDQAEVHIDVEVNFDERKRLLQMPISWAARERCHTDGLPGGHLARQTSVVEWPFQAWSHCQTPLGSAAVFSHDIFSLSHRAEETILTLLRAPIMANAGNTPLVYAGRDDHTDQGIHTFHIEVAFGAELNGEALHRRADQMVKRPIHFDYYDGMERPLPLAANPTPPNSMVAGPTPTSINSVNRQ